MYFWLCWAFTVALGLSLVAVSEGCSLVAELGCRAWLSSVAPGLSCPMACRIFQDQESNPSPLHWQADSDWATREVLLLLFWSKRKMLLLPWDSNAVVGQLLADIVLRIDGGILDPDTLQTNACYYCELEFSEVYQDQGYRHQFSKQYLPAAAQL